MTAPMRLDGARQICGCASVCIVGEQLVCEAVLQRCVGLQFSSAAMNAKRPMQSSKNELAAGELAQQVRRCCCVPTAMRVQTTSICEQEVTVCVSIA